MAHRECLGEDQEAREDELTQSLQYIQSCNDHPRYAYLKKTAVKEWEYEKYQKFLGGKPMEVIKHTFEATILSMLLSIIQPLSRDTISQGSQHLTSLECRRCSAQTHGLDPHLQLVVIPVYNSIME